MLRDALGRRAQLATGVFHEELSAARRDTEVARFRAEDGPSILISTEAGGEGRNFEFCHRLVLYDLPWKPSTVEQRIGRLDRIGRAHAGRDRLLPSARRGSARTSCGCSNRSACSASRWPVSSRSSRMSSEHSKTIALDAALVGGCADRSAARGRAGRADTYSRGGVSRVAPRPYHAELGPAILARIPAGPRRAHRTCRRQRRLAPGISRRAGPRPSRLRDRVRQRGASSTACRVWPPGLRRWAPSIASTRSKTRRSTSSHRGTRSSKDCCSHFEDYPIGRVARLELQIPGEAGRGIVAIYKDGPRFAAQAIDSEGRRRPDWEDAFRRGPLSGTRMTTADVAEHDWRELADRVAPLLGPTAPYAIAAVVVRTAGTQRPRTG